MLYHMHLKKYLENQIEEMKKYKWVRGQELGRDQGENAFKEWAQKYASQYRKEYEEMLDDLVDSVSKNVEDKIKEILEDKYSSEEIKKLVYLIINDFTHKWMEEKIDNPNNQHLDEI